MKARTLASGGLALLILLLGCLALLWTGLDFGEERWPVKTMRDRDRDRVRPAPVDTTVASLTRLSRPPDAALLSRSRIAPEERTVYRVRAKLRRLSEELDGDIHMVLADPDDSSLSIIAEIPHPLVSLGSGLGGVFRAERALARSHAHDPGATVEVTGVGFFDSRTHEAAGGAANGFELHPVIGLKFIDTR